MSKYVASIIRYTDRPKDGRYLYPDAIPYAEFKSFDTLTLARKYAFQRLSHTSFNKGGEYMCIITKGWHEFKGEVLNTAFDDRYWYPSNDGVYASAGKYTLYKDGTLGRRLR